MYSIWYITLPQVSNIRCGFPLFKTCVLEHVQASSSYRNMYRISKTMHVRTHNMSIQILIYSMRKYWYLILKVKSQPHFVIVLHFTCIRSPSYTHLTLFQRQQIQINTFRAKYFRCILRIRMIHDHTMELWLCHDSIETVSLTSFNKAINSCLQSLDKHFNTQIHRLIDYYA